MKCIQCQRDSKKKDRLLQGGICPGCHHAFVAEPSEDGLTDRMIQTAENVVSGNGTFYFLKAHLKYQLHRRLKKKLKLCQFFVAVLSVAFVISLFFAMKGGGFIALTVLCGFFLSAGVGSKAKFHKALDRLDNTVSRWIAINPNPKMLMGARYQNTNSSSNLRDLQDISFDRVLICDRNELVDFFLSNLFHFHYSCPILGGNGYPDGICQDMLVRLKQNPTLKVFLLHDYTPQGHAFVNRIKTDPNWFGGRQQFNIIDLGLMTSQKKLFKAMTQKVRNRDNRVSETAELAIFKPAVFISLCGMAINEGVPLHLLSNADNHYDSDTGYG